MSGLRAAAAVLLVAGWSTAARAEVITIEPDNPLSGTCLPFEVVSGAETWLPFAGYIYDNIPPFTLQAGSALAFDTVGENDVDIQLDIAMTPGNKLPNFPFLEEAEPFTQVVSNTQLAENPRGNDVLGDYDLRFSVEQPFNFPGGVLIIQFSNPAPGFSADNTCQIGITFNGGDGDPSGFFEGAFLADADGLSPYDQFISTSVGAFQVDTGGLDLDKVTLNSAGDEVSSISVGNAVTWRITVLNDSGADATGIEIVDTLPDGIAFIDATATPSAAAVFDAGPPATVTWTVGALADGESATLDIRADILFALANALLTNTAAITAVDGPLVPGDQASADLLVNDVPADILSQSDGCFIATAAYGSYLAPEVRVLRRFRDRYLLTNEPGRAFVRLYYRVSPDLAASLSRNDLLRSVVRVLLTPLVYGLKYPVVAACAGMLGLLSILVVAGGRRQRASRENIR